MSPRTTKSDLSWTFLAYIATHYMIESKRSTFASGRQRRTIGCTADVYYVRHIGCKPLITHIMIPTYQQYSKFLRFRKNFAQQLQIIELRKANERTFFLVPMTNCFIFHVGDFWRLRRWFCNISYRYGRTCEHCSSLRNLEIFALYFYNTRNATM